MGSVCGLREWCLITITGGLETGGGGASKVLPLQKWGGGRGRKVLATLKVGPKRFEVVATWDLDVAILMGGGGRK